MTASARCHSAIDELTPGQAAFTLSFRNEDPRDEVVVDWPASLGATDALDLVSFAADRRSLIVAQSTATGTDLFEIADPIGRAVGGRLDDPQPARLAHLEGRSLQIDPSPDGGWLTVVNR